jgi:hypothetical protein
MGECGEVQGMSDDLPACIWSGSFNICGVEMRCHVLSDGQRIIEAESMERFLAAMDGSAPPTIDLDQMRAFQRWRMGAK